MTSWKIHHLNGDVFFLLNIGDLENVMLGFLGVCKSYGKLGTRFGGLYLQVTQHILVEVEVLIVRVVRCDDFSCVFFSYLLRN